MDSPIKDIHGYTWSPVIMMSSLMGYQRDDDSFFWPGDPRVPTAVGIGWMGVSKKTVLPPSVEQVAKKRQQIM